MSYPCLLGDKLPDMSQPPPGYNTSDMDLKPKLPYFSLPSALMVPLIEVRLQRRFRSTFSPRHSLHSLIICVAPRIRFPREPSRTPANPRELPRTLANSREPSRTPANPRELPRTLANPREPSRTPANPREPTSAKVIVFDLSRISRDIQLLENYRVRYNGSRRSRRSRLRRRYRSAISRSAPTTSDYRLRRLRPNASCRP